MNWGNPRSLQEIWWHITGRQYRVFFSFSPAIMGTQFVEFCRMALREFGFPWLPLSPFLAFAGFAERFQARSHSFLVSAVDRHRRSGLLPQLRNCRGQGRVLFAGIYFDRDRSRVRHSLVDPTLRSRPSPMWRPYVAAAIAIVLTSATAFAANWPFNNRRHYFIADDYVENLFSTIAPDGLLLTQDWQVASPMFYAQEMEQRRPM